MRLCNSVTYNLLTVAIDFYGIKKITAEVNAYCQLFG